MTTAKISAVVRVTEMLLHDFSDEYCIAFKDRLEWRLKEYSEPPKPRLRVHLGKGA